MIISRFLETANKQETRDFYLYKAWLDYYATNKTERPRNPMPKTLPVGVRHVLLNNAKEDNIKYLQTMFSDSTLISTMLSTNILKWLEESQSEFDSLRKERDYLIDLFYGNLFQKLWFYIIDGKEKHNKILGKLWGSRTQLKGQIYY